MIKKTINTFNPSNRMDVGCQLIRGKWPSYCPSFVAVVTVAVLVISLFKQFSLFDIALSYTMFCSPSNKTLAPHRPNEEPGAAKFPIVGLDSNPIWENSTNEPDAVHLLADGLWLGPHLSLLRDEETNLLKWSEEITSRMTLENASTRVAFQQWNQQFTSLYGTANLMNTKHAKFMCRLSWGFHWCDPVNHGFNYHAKYWSSARGIEILESFVRLSDGGRMNPSILFMGDSVLMETWNAGVCSLARANVTFLTLCPDRFRFRSSGGGEVCFRHPRINGTGVLSAFSDQGFDKSKWKKVIFGCSGDSTDCKPRLDNHRWDVILPNLGVHYNTGSDGLFKNGQREYRRDLADLFQLLLDSAQYQTENKIGHRTLHLFWGSSPQHFQGSPNGLYLPGQKLAASSCSAVYPSSSAFQSNRQRTRIAWEVMIELLVNTTGKSCNNDSILHDPSHPQTRSILQSPCMAKLMNTCQGGLSHLEVEPFFTHRPEAHPGGRCSYVYPISYDKDPTGEKCDPKKNFRTDCTHHCWGPLLYQPIWERLEISVKFHMDRCIV